MDNETYGYLPTNNVGHETDQFLILQDDGSFIITKQIQYVAQEPINKEIPISSVPVYNMQPQQYFVNVNTPTEFIVPEPIILPNTSNNLYNNGYLLQTEAPTTEQVEEVPAIPTQYHQQINTNVLDTSNIQANNCTEITLSDEQYQTLEQKGWILLESKDKIFVLNSLGLHDITDNGDLIQKLRNEIYNNSNVEINTGLNNAPVIPDEDLNTKQSSVEIVVEDDEEIQNDQSVCFVLGDKEKYQEVTDIESQQEDFDYDDEIQSPSASLQHETVEVFREQESNSIKIKTKFIFDNIPNKIILGKTVNGKRIVANVTKKNKPGTCDKAVENKQPGSLDLSESQFLGLIHHALRSYSDTFCAEDIPAANGFILQLLNVPSLKKIVVGQNIIVTKSTTRKDANGKLSKLKTTLLTGKVHSNDEEECFTHIPDLLQTLLLRQDSNLSNQQDIVRPTIIENDLTIFHTHVSEVVSEDNAVKVHINLAKRQFDIDSVLDYKLRKPQKTYACAACATMFPTPNALKQHHDGQCTEAEDDLPIDMNILDKHKPTYSVIKSGTDKSYNCTQCDAKFSKISHCQKHVNTHIAPTTPKKPKSRKKTNSEPMNIDMTKAYKCKMCPATFYHQSSLSRHIVTRHIKLKEK